jgi:hypothetical protein
MIDLENPRVRMLLVFIGLMAATFIIISTYNLMAQSQQLAEMNQRICADITENQSDLGIRMIQGYADSMCDCKPYENGTWICVYSKEKASSMTKNISRRLK